MRFRDRGVLVIGIVKGDKIRWTQPGSQITGEKIPGDLESWQLYQTDINEALSSSYGLLQERSSTLYHSYAPVTSAINKTSAYAVGGGLVFRSHPDHRILGIDRQEAMEWGKQFQLLIHYYARMLGWYEKQSVVFRGALIMGDSLLYFVRDDGGLDLVEAGGDTIDYKHADGAKWDLGVLHDKYQRRAGIWTGQEVRFQDAVGDQQVIQFMLKELPRQLRGLPLAYKIIALAKSHDRHLDATVQRAVLESIMMGYSNTDTTNIATQIKNQAESASRKKGIARSAWERITGTRNLGAGNIYQLKTGESINFTDLKTPSNNFGPFNEWLIKFVAMATDTTPGIIMSNYPTSYSSHRGEFNDFWKMVQLKRRIFEDKVARVVVRELAKKLILDGTISAPGFFDSQLNQEAWLAGSFLGPVPGHINPRQEVEAHRISVEQSFQTRADIASLYGNEWDNMIDEWGEQEAKWAGLSDDNQAEIIQEEVALV